MQYFFNIFSNQFITVIPNGCSTTKYSIFVVMKLFALPNWFTLANLFSGSLACLFVWNGKDIHYILFFIVFSLLMDLLDGMIARLTNTQSELGVQLDSLADMVSFGLLPGIMMLKLLQFDLILLEKQDDLLYYIFLIMSSLGLLVTLFSALRLAKFNIDTEQTYYFKGLPTPANTLFLFSMYWLATQDKVSVISNPVVILLLIAISCYLLVSTIPLFALKFKGFAWENNELKYIFLLSSLVLIVLFQMKAVPVIILAYILVSIVYKKKILDGTL